jgi:hypothetical protein
MISESVVGGTRHEKSSRRSWSAFCQRSQAVLTVVGEHAIELATWRNDSPA